MSDHSDILEYNATLHEKGLVGELAENTPWEPVGRFVAAVGITGKAILDIGCCTGAIASQIAKAAGPWESYQGVDLCPAYVDEFNRRGLNGAKAAVGDVAALSGYATSSVDVVLCLSVLQHLGEDDGRLALREIRRVCRPGAEILLGVTINRDRDEDEKLYASEKAIKAGAKPVPTKIRWRDKLLQMVEEERFEIVGLPEEIPGRGAYALLFIRMVPRK